MRCKKEPRGVRGRRNEGSVIEYIDACRGRRERRPTTAGSDGKRQERKKSDVERERDHESTVSLLSSSRRWGI